MTDKQALKIILDFVERWNKQDTEKDVAEAAVVLGQYLLDNLFHKDTKYDQDSIDKALGYDKSKLEALTQNND